MGNKRAELRKAKQVLSDKATRVLTKNPDAVHLGHRYVLVPMRKAGKFQIQFRDQYVGYCVVNAEGAVRVHTAANVTNEIALNLEADEAKIKNAAVIANATRGK